MSDVYLNGEILPLEKAQVSVLDRGFLFGDGVYEVIPVFHGYPLRLEEHLERLSASLTAIHLPVEITVLEWHAIFDQLLSRNAGQHQALYIQISRGSYASRQHGFPAETRPTVFVMTMPLAPRITGSLDDVKGGTAITAPDQRWQRCDIKSTSLLGNVMHHQLALNSGATEAILVDAEGRVTEGSSSNVFIVRDETIITPPRSHKILSGITRALVLELAVNDGAYRCEERDVSVDELKNADEIWVTSSSKEMLPIIELNGIQVGKGEPGSVWRHVAGLYQTYKAG
ncbi:D-amino acid aminotransferase [Kistimonas asteriae]|uniref:D-amino acid aminotransferase n=1 Tax=Kistimonas asteriae TaxID=517724 RepID=UPI001BAA5228|nr:D-amino acid aminotransferase [Kistimonas asteriae]